MSETARESCRRKSWLAALVAGGLVAAMLVAVAHSGVVASLAIGLGVAALLGVFLVWAFCKEDTVVATPERAVPAPASMPVGATPEPLKAAAPAQTAPAVAVATAAVPVAREEAPKPAARPGAAPKPKPKPKLARAEAAALPGAAEASARKAHSGSALDAALAKSKEPALRAGPQLLAAPRGGRADDLKQIKGVGPKLEQLLNDVGVWHFDQIAAWKAKDIAFVDGKMQGFKGRISRDGWVRQAKVLAAGGTTEFSERVSTGDVHREVE